MVQVRGITWYMDRRTVIKIFREEVGIKSGAHQNNFQVRSLCDQVLQHQQQEVTESRSFREKWSKYIKTQLRINDQIVHTSPLFARAPRPRWRARRLGGPAHPPASSAARQWCSTAVWWLTTNEESKQINLLREEHQERQRGTEPYPDALQADLVAHRVAQALGSLLCDSLSHGDGRNAARLGAEDVGHLLRGAAQRGVQNELRDLSRLTAPARKIQPWNFFCR